MKKIKNVLLKNWAGYMLTITNVIVAFQTEFHWLLWLAIALAILSFILGLMNERES